MNLSEKETKVLLLILAGAIVASSIAEQSELPINSVHAIINSLVKKELITKAEDKTLVPTEKAKEYQASLMTASLKELPPMPLHGTKAGATENNTEENTNKPQLVQGTQNDAPPVIPTGAEGSNEPAREPDVQVEQKDKVINILIPYLKSEAAGEELRYALRAWEHSFKQPHRIVVIGDSEPWFSPEIIHIPHEIHLIKEDCNCPAPSMVRNPQADVTHKIFTAIAAGEITGDFILTNDDIYLLGATQLSDIESLKAFGSLVCPENTSLSLYHRNSNRTAKILESENLPTHRYGTHTPMVLNAEKLIEVIEKYKALDNGYLLTSLYFNEVHPDARPIQVTGGANDPILASAYRHDISAEVLKDVFRTRKFINCNSKGWKAIEPFLKNLYQSPSRFEI